MNSGKRAKEEKNINEVVQFLLLFFQACILRLHMSTPKNDCSEFVRFFNAAKPTKRNKMVESKQVYSCKKII